MTAPRRQPLDDLTAAVADHRQHLLDSYQPIHLHQWRVHIRRIRSLMKYLPAYRDRALRAAWRELFVVSNPARDWDVFILELPSLLPSAEAAALAGALDPLVQKHHKRVLEMLVSGRWVEHLDEWRTFLESLESPPPVLPPSVLPEVLAQAEQARIAALQADDRATWHRLRIAIKNLRYVIDAILQLGAGGGQTRLEALIEECKVLQDTLGAWHDSMVQLELIDAPLTARQLADFPDRAAIHHRLVTALEQRRDRLLETAREQLPALDLQLDADSASPAPGPA